ncbi:MAG: phosphatase PAP2 family protein [Bacillota bacterium]|nr:phosphatase PAP2 family protein [Bacillota bacterium]
MELLIIKWIQSFSNSFLDLFFQGVTILGEETFILLFFVVLYWTINKNLGKFIGYSFFISLLINTALKDFFHSARPIGIDGIKSLRTYTATGYSFPSGHTQAVTALFASLCIFSRKKTVYIISTILILLVGISRIYLGLHWPKDVIGAIVIGLTIVLLSYYSYINKYHKAVLLSILLLGSPFIIYFNTSGYPIAYGITFGYFFGTAFEKKYANFTIHKNLKKNILRIAFGLIGLLAIKEGFKILLPEHYYFDVLRYALLSFYGLGFFPLLIRKYNL